MDQSQSNNANQSLTQGAMILGITDPSPSTQSPGVWSRVFTVAPDEFGKSTTRTFFGRAPEDDAENLEAVRWDYGFCRRPSSELIGKQVKSIGLFSTSVYPYTFNGRDGAEVLVTTRTVIVMSSESPTQALHTQGLYLPHEQALVEANMERLARNGYNYEIVDEATGEMKGIAVPEPTEFFPNGLVPA